MLYVVATLCVVFYNHGAHGIQPTNMQVLTTIMGILIVNKNNDKNRQN